MTLARLIVLACALAAGCATTTSPAARDSQTFSFRDIRGKRLRFGGQRDKAVLLVFWSSWCTRCFGKLRFLDRLYRDNKVKGFRLIGAAMDQPQTRARVRPAVMRYKLSFPTFIDAQGKLILRYNPRRIQTYGVLFHRGRVVERWSPIQTADLSAVKARVLALLR